MEIALLLIGLIVGFAFGYFFFKSRTNAIAGIPQDEYQSALDKVNMLQIEKGKLEERVRMISEELKSFSENITAERNKNEQLTIESASLKTSNENLLKNLNEQEHKLKELEERFKIEFQNIANKLLDENSKKFTMQNKENLDNLLNPLKEKIQTFEKKVEETHRESLEKNAGLIQQILHLKEMNQKISEEAQQLTKALKGDTKKQGNWGELILEKVLERSGLVKDAEYKTQFSTTNVEGSRIQPDVIIFLPDSKHIIIDSKVSLLAYNNMVNAEMDEQREKFLAEHIASVKNHIKGLSDKSYQSSGDLTTPDFVLLFMPIESSFSVAIQSDNELFNFAWDRKIVIVSPSTLLATLRTIASIWKQERQTRNALEIARQAGGLYDKFTGFINDLVEVGKKMDMAKSSYSDAMNKLSSGSGNIVKRVEDLKKLGAKTEKAIPQALVDRAVEE
jgi:DNA recombination protein RmuC